MYKTTLLIAFIIQELVKLQAINVISYQKLDFTAIKSGWYISLGYVGCFSFHCAVEWTRVSGSLKSNSQCSFSHLILYPWCTWFDTSPQTRASSLERLCQLYLAFQSHHIRCSIPIFCQEQFSNNDVRWQIHILSFSFYVLIRQMSDHSDLTVRSDSVCVLLCTALSGSFVSSLRCPLEFACTRLFVYICECVLV